MSFSFSLISEGWIPCVTSSGEGVELGLLEALRRAPELREIADPSPPVTAALHRLLLAILHRNFGPQNSREWRRMWEAGCWDVDVLEAYFEQWRERFDLFHPERPFYQAAGMLKEGNWLKPASKLATELAAGHNPTLFAHTYEEEGYVLTPAQAARLLVARQGYDIDSICSGEATTGKAHPRAAVHAAGATLLVTDTSIWRTLMLNLTPYDPEHSLPIAGTSGDAPAWEQEPIHEPQTRFCRGYLDYLTWQSRRIWLEPSMGSDGREQVRRVTIADGVRLPDDPFVQDPLMANVKRERATAGRPPWVPISFTEYRALWRDSTALLRSVPDRFTRAAVMDFLARLIFEGTLSRSAVYRLSALGFASSQAKVFFWRHERLPLPLAYLADEDLVDSLTACLRLAEDTAGALRQALWRLASELLAPGEDREPDRDAVNAMLRAFPAESLYWSTLEPEFHRLVVNLAADPASAEQTEDRWGRLLRDTAWSAFEDTAGRLNPDARALRAVVVGRGSLAAGLARVFDDVTQEEEQHAPTQ